MKLLFGISTRSRRRAVAFSSLVALLAVGAAGCGGSSPKNGVAGARHAMSASVTTRMIKGLGPVLVNAQGRTLYVFARDQQQRVTCTGSCAQVWPPLTGNKPTAGGAAQSSMLGSDMNPAGGSVVTYAKWPLYTYTGDTGPGTANGQALKLNGGLWYVISPAGKVIKTKPTSGGGGGTTTSGGGGY